MSDFERVNQPRVDKIMKMLDLIEKSALSYRVTRLQFQALMSPVLHRTRGKDEPAPMTQVKPEAAPPVAREMSALSDLTTQQLVDRMIACGAELATRRK